MATLSFSPIRIQPVRAADYSDEYFFQFFYDPLDTDGDGKNNAIKVTMDADSNYSGSQPVRALVVLRDGAHPRVQDFATGGELNEADVLLVNDGQSLDAIRQRGRGGARHAGAQQNQDADAKGQERALRNTEPPKTRSGP